MTANVGGIDKILRYLAGIVIIVLGIYFKSWWGGDRPDPTAHGCDWMVPTLRTIQNLNQKKSISTSSHRARIERCTRIDRFYSRKYF